MKELRRAIEKFLVACYPAGLSTEKIEVDTQIFFTVVIDGKNLSLGRFVKEFYPSGKEMITGKEDYFIVANNHHIGFIKNSLWYEHQDNNNNRNLTYTIIEDTREIVKLE